MECDYSIDFKFNYDRYRNNYINFFVNKCNFCLFFSDNDRVIIKYMVISYFSIDEDIIVVIFYVSEEEDEVVVEIDIIRGTID